MRGRLSSLVRGTRRRISRTCRERMMTSGWRLPDCSGKSWPHTNRHVLHWSLCITIQCNTTLLSLCREICLLARHLHKTFNTFNNKRSTSQWYTELKTAQIQEKYLTITMYTITNYNVICGILMPRQPHRFRWGRSKTMLHTVSYNSMMALLLPVCRMICTQNDAWCWGHTFTRTNIKYQT